MNLFIFSVGIRVYPLDNYFCDLRQFFFFSEVNDFTDAQSLLSMSLAGERMAGLDPAISEALQHSPGYLDMARVALLAPGCKHPSSTSPLSSIRSGCASASFSGSQHKAQQPLYSPVITLANANYHVTKTYPLLFIVPSVSLMDSFISI